MWFLEAGKCFYYKGCVYRLMTIHLCYGKHSYQDILIICPYISKNKMDYGEKLNIHFGYATVCNMS